MTKKLPKLTVLIPTKNEEKTIGECIESVIAAVKDIDAEIMLIDSFSTDHTLEIAKKYPIRIYQLKKHWFKSIGAGLYVGVNMAKGKYIQYIDGDSVFDKKWFKKAIAFLDKAKDPKIAGAVGYWEYDKKGHGTITSQRKNVEKRTRRAQHIGGPILFKGKVLRKHNYYPFFRRAVDAELGQRLMSLGYKIRFLPIKMLTTHDRPLDVKKLIHRSFHYGVTWGAALKKNRNKLYILKRVLPKNIIFIMTLFCFFIFVFLWFPTSMFLLLLFLPVLIYLQAKRGLNAIALSFVLFLFKTSGIFGGLLKVHKRPERYPKNITVIKDE